MEGMKDVKSDGSVGDEIQKEVVFINLPLMITALLDLSALKVRPVCFKARVNEESKVLAPQIVKDILFRSSMKALLAVKRCYLDETVVRWLPKSILELYSYQIEKGYRVQPAKIPRWCLCQQLCLQRKRHAKYPGVVSFD